MDKVIQNMIYFLISQVLCVAEAVLFTERCEAALRRRSLPSLLSELEAQLESFTSVDLQGEEGEEEDDADAKVKRIPIKKNSCVHAFRQCPISKL